jgi:MoaA/NifB/PqqE/SkfB family radical SAM enzyme
VPVEYFINVNFICNERCVFCAADLADGPDVSSPGNAQLSLDSIVEWIHEKPPGPGDAVSIAGGEPTLHPQLIPVVRYLARQGPAITLFTNGIRLVDSVFARELLRAGVSTIEIGLFGANAAEHEAVTRRRGSFERTLTAMRVLGGLHEEFQFSLVVRLLVARQCMRQNPAIVHMVHETVDGVTSFSLNRLILSHDAEAADAAVTWEEARPWINATAQSIRALGYDLGYAGLPLCVYEGDNAYFILRRTRELKSMHAFGGRRSIRYLDPSRNNADPTDNPRAWIALPRACRVCDYLPYCGRIEQWYLNLFGTAGITPIRLPR